MKKLTIIITIIFCSVSLFSQDNKKSDAFQIFIGSKYTPFDYLGGGFLGFSYTIDRFSFSFRNDISLSISKIDPHVYFGINKYRVYNYLDVYYKVNKKISTSIGYGWVSNKNEIHRLNNEYGYSVLSFGMNYLISRKIAFELKGDLPLVKRNYRFFHEVAFPLSMGLVYIIK